MNRRTNSPTKPLPLVLDLLDGVRPGTDGCIALCPAHDDVNPSLSVSEADDGKVLIKCFAGCETQEVVEALGLEMRDLFSRTRTTSRRRGGKQHGPHA
jgi:hypothetical protein